MRKALVNRLFALWVCIAANGSAAPAVQQVFTERFILRNWDLDGGLPSTRINAVARTPDGFLWLATPGGLTRFDGERFRHWSEAEVPALKGTRIARVFVDGTGELWVGTMTGVVGRWNHGTLVVEVLPEHTGGKAISRILEATDGAIWMGTDGAGLLRLSSQGREHFTMEHGLPSLNIQDVVCDDAGTLWCVSAGRLLCFTDGAWHATAGEAPSGQPITALARATAGGLWVATHARERASSTGACIFRMERLHWTELPDPYLWAQDSPRSRIDALLEDQSGRLWCASAGRGVFTWTQEQQWERLVDEAPLSQLEAICLAEDEAETIWIGTRTSGLHQARPRPVKASRLPPSAEQHILWTTAVDHQGQVWGGTDGGGIYRWNPSGVSQSAADQGLSNSYVRVLLADVRSNLWAGTQAGLFQWCENQFEPVPGPAGLSGFIASLMQDRQGNLWVGSRDGLIRLGNGVSHIYGPSHGLPRAPATVLAEDNAGGVWAVCGRSGLYQKAASEDRFVRHTNLPRHLESSIRTMVCTEDGSLWMGAEGYGLIQLKAGSTRMFNYQDDGLPSNHHLAILPDTHGDLWVSSENGIFGFSPLAWMDYQRGSGQRLPVWRLTPNEGMVQKVCTGAAQPAAAMAPDGSLWFPNGHALASFLPGDVPQSFQAWPPVVEEVLVDGVLLPSAAAQGLSVLSSSRRFEFRYTSPNIVAPERLRFRFRLKGHDEAWVDAGNQRVAYYNQLPPGEYAFQVMAMGRESEWQPAAQDLAITVIPLFYERPLVRTFFAVSFLAAVAGMAALVQRARYRRRMARLHMHRAMDQERQRIARDIHDDLGSGLTEITLLSDTLEAEGPETTAGRDMVSEISRRARALTRAMDEVVWAVNPRNDTLESFLTYFNRWAQAYLTHAGVRCRWDLPLDIPPLPLNAETRHHLFLSCKEAINNIAKHAGATEVWVRVQVQPGQLEISIEDNGRGLDSPASGREGEGLRNMRSRMNELKGRCDLHSLHGKGTRVTFTLPLPPDDRST
jgi:signal transduction histidine kinase/ligand-binding sensor domain-containing protein